MLRFSPEPLGPMFVAERLLKYSPGRGTLSKRSVRCSSTEYFPDALGDDPRGRRSRFSHSHRTDNGSHHGLTSIFPGRVCRYVDSPGLRVVIASCLVQSTSNESNPRSCHASYSWLLWESAPGVRSTSDVELKWSAFGKSQQRSSSFGFQQISHQYLCTRG